MGEPELHIDALLDARFGEIILNKVFNTSKRLFVIENKASKMPKSFV